MQGYFPDHTEVPPDALLAKLVSTHLQLEKIDSHLEDTKAAFSGSQKGRIFHAATPWEGNKYLQGEQIAQGYVPQAI